MNIFILHKDPIIAAQYHCDKHVVKMILESTQILSTALREVTKNQFEYLYKSTHRKHPCTLWTMESKQNFIWLLKHSIALSDEYTFRYKKIHGSLSIIKNVKDCFYNENFKSFNNKGLTSFAQAMPQDLKTDDAIESYRNYYLRDKQHLLTYSVRSIPDWIKNLGFGKQK